MPGEMRGGALRVDLGSLARRIREASAGKWRELRSALGVADRETAVTLVQQSEKSGRLILQSVKTRFRPFEPISLEIVDDEGVPEIHLVKPLSDEVIETVRACLETGPVDFKAIQESVSDEGIAIGREKLRAIVKNMPDVEITAGTHNKQLFQCSSFPGTFQ